MKESLNFAPIALFVYSRPDHTRKTVEALQLNELSIETDLIVFSDAARTPDKEVAVAAVREYVAGITGFRTVRVKHRPYNYGLANSIIDGVTSVLAEYDRVIVLEDDLVTSPYFLQYMNDGLRRFAEDDRVASIHGYVYPVSGELPEAFFLRGADCWGWATWRRGWCLFNPDGQKLLDELRQRKLLREFDMHGAYGYSAMLEGQIQGRNDSWAIRWHASAFLAGKLTLYPGRSLVRNIGNDDSGTHCGSTDRYDVHLSLTPVRLDNVAVEVSTRAQKLIEDFLRSGSSLPQRAIGKVLPMQMQESMKALFKDLLPPMVLRSVKKLYRGEGIRFEGEFWTWEDAASHCAGYDAEHILAKVLDATLKVKRGEVAFERDSVLFDEIEYVWPVVAGLMWAAARNGGCLNVLDFGGALGSSYFQNRALLKGLPDVRWNVVEQAHYVEAGKKHVEDERLHFYETIEQCLVATRPNVVLFSCVLQYVSEPGLLLQQGLNIRADCIILDRMPYLNAGLSSVIKIQKTPDSIYHASYPCRFFVEKELIRTFNAEGYDLISLFPSLEKLDDSATWKGHIYYKRQAQ